MCKQTVEVNMRYFGKLVERSMQRDLLMSICHEMLIAKDPVSRNHITEYAIKTLEKYRSKKFDLPEHPEY